MVAVKGQDRILGLEFPVSCDGRQSQDRVGEESGRVPGATPVKAAQAEVVSMYPDVLEEPKVLDSDPRQCVQLVASPKEDSKVFVKHVQVTGGIPSRGPQIVMDGAPATKCMACGKCKTRINCKHCIKQV